MATPAAAAAPVTAPVDAPVATPVTAPIAAPATRAGGLIEQQDVDDWKDRFNDVFSRPKDHVTSKSPAGAQGWLTSFFGCCTPIDRCLFTCCFPCVTFGKVHHRVSKNGELSGFVPINASCALFCGASCCGLHWIPASMQRAGMREKYNLEGSCLGDLAKAYCCACCNLIQMDKEAKVREQLLSSGTEQYQANVEMVYPEQPKVKSMLDSRKLGA